MQLRRSECLLLFLYFTVFHNLVDIETKTKTETSTVCYGSPGVGCTDHELECTNSKVISLTNVKFGYRRWCSAVGVAYCDSWAKRCCKKRKNDCFTPFNETVLSELQAICNAKSKCFLNKNQLNEKSTFCDFGDRFHSYSIINYQCVKKVPIQPTAATPGLAIPASTVATSTLNTVIFPTQQSTTQRNRSTTSISTSNQPTTTVIIETLKQGSSEIKDQTDEGGIIGGIVGVLLVGVIVGVVIFFIKRRKRTDSVPPNNAHVKSSYDTGVTLPATTAPVYFELESNNNTDQTTTQLTSSDNYDIISADNHAKLTKRNDNYNHIGVNVVTSDGDYHYLKGNNSNKATAVPDCNYNHVGLFTTEEDNYHHIGGNQSEIITEDNYNHIVGHNNTGLESDDYHHIGDSREQLVVTDDTYNHIGDAHDEVLAGGEYNHIGYGQELPSMVDVNYPVEDSGDYSAIRDADGDDDHSAEAAEGIYSLAKRI